jgi:hypothetical protein
VSALIVGERQRPLFVRAQVGQREWQQLDAQRTGVAVQHSESVQIILPISDHNMRTMWMWSLFFKKKISI